MNDLGLIERSYIIVTKHKGLVKWLEMHGIIGEVLTYMPYYKQVRGKILVGAESLHIPLTIAAECEAVILVVMPGMAEELKGVDLAPEQIDGALGRLEKFAVKRRYIGQGV